jgi:AcrR family transcriptional regulator
MPKMDAITQDSMQKSHRRVGRPKRGEFHGREILLDKALHAFALKGYDGVSMRSLAKDAQVNLALASYHFGSKHELWIASVEHMQKLMQPRMEKLAAIVTSDEDYVLRLRRHSWNLLLMLAELPNYSMLLAQEGMRPSERQELVYQSLVLPLMKPTMALTREGMDKGVIPNQSAQILYFTALAAMSHFFSSPDVIHPTLPEPNDRDTFLKLVFKTHMLSLTGNQAWTAVPEE